MRGFRVSEVTHGVNGGCCVVLERRPVLAWVFLRDGRATYAGRGMSGDDVRRMLAGGADADVSGEVERLALEWVRARAKRGERGTPGANPGGGRNAADPYPAPYPDSPEALRGLRRVTVTP